MEIKGSECKGVLIPYLERLRLAGTEFQIILKYEIRNNSGDLPIDNSTVRIVSMANLKFCFIDLSKNKRALSEKPIVALKLSSNLPALAQYSNNKSIPLYFLRKDSNQLQAFRIEKPLFSSISNITNCKCKHDKPVQFFPFILTFDENSNKKCNIYGLIVETLGTDQFSCLKLTKAIRHIEKNISDDINVFDGRKPIPLQPD